MSCTVDSRRHTTQQRWTALTALELFDGDSDRRVHRQRLGCWSGRVRAQGLPAARAVTFTHSSCVCVNVAVVGSNICSLRPVKHHDRSEGRVACLSAAVCSPICTISRARISGNQGEERGEERGSRDERSWSGVAEGGLRRRRRRRSLFCTKDKDEMM